MQTETDVFESLETDEAVEYQALVRSLRLAKHFTLIFARCNQRPKQEEICKKLVADLPDKKLAVIYFPKSIDHLLDELRREFAKKKPEAVFVYGLESSMPKADTAYKTPFVLNLNAARNSFPLVVDCPVVLCIPDYGIRAIMNGAPDFFSVRSGVFYFENDREYIAKQTSEAISLSQSDFNALSFEERRNRIKNLQDLLADHESLPNHERDAEAELQLKDKLAHAYYASGQFADSEKLRLELWNRANEEKNESEIAFQANELALLYQALGKYTEAEPLFRKALEIREKGLGEDHTDTATGYNNLAGLYNLQARYEEAESLYKKALEINKKALGEDHTSIAFGYNNLAELYRSLGRYEEAESLYKKSLEIREKVLGEDHPDAATGYNNLALIYKLQGRYEEAEPLFKKALEIDEKVVGENHPNTAASYNNLAGLYRAQGRYEEAESLYKKSLEIKEKIFGENHPDTALTYWSLGAFYHERGRSKRGLKLCEKALGIYKKMLPAGHPSITRCESWVKGIKKSINAQQKTGGGGRTLVSGKPKKKRSKK